MERANSLETLVTAYIITLKSPVCDFWKW